MDYSKMNNINKLLSKVNIENNNLKVNIYRNYNYMMAESDFDSESDLYDGG